MDGTEPAEQGRSKAKRNAEARPAPPRRSLRMSGLADVLPEVTGKALGGRGVALAALLKHWPDIVGPHLAKLAAPVRLVPRSRERNEAALVLAVRRAGQLDVEYGQDRILERLNAFLGYRGIVALSQIPWPPGMEPRVAQPPAAPRPPLRRNLDDAALADIADPALREALAGLKAGLAHRAAKKG